MDIVGRKRVRKRVYVYSHLRDFRRVYKMGLTTVIKDYGTEILNAIRENDLQKLKTVLEKYLKADKKIQKLCIADIKHKPTKKFACPLILAARQEDPRIMKYMMDKGVDPNFVHHTIFSSKRKEIVTALHISVDLGLYDTVQILLDANADANIGDHNQETPLHISVKKADKVMTRMLLSKGADPKIPDRRGNAALHVATLYGHLQLVRTMLKYDADVYQKGQWDAVPPHIAAKEGHIHLIQLFCSRDVGNINIKIPCYLDKREKAPIHLAAENGHVETVLALVDQFDAEVNLKDSDGNTPLHCVVLNQYNPHRMRDKEYFNETAKVLIKFGVSINEKNVYGDTALHLAAMNQFQRIVELLLQIGASPFLENDEKLKPIDVVPDFDPVTKQVLKNAMLNPRPTISASRSTLLSRDISSMMSSHNIFRKPRSIGSISPEPGIEPMHRSISKGSINSSVTVESSVFEDPIKNQKHRDPFQGHGHKGRRPPSSNGSDRYDDEERNSVLYSKVNKPKKQTSNSNQQTDRKQMHNYGNVYENEKKPSQSYGTQFDNVHDESVSMISVQDHMTQVSMKTESTVVNNQLRNIVNKDRKHRRRDVDGDYDRIESVSDIARKQRRNFQGDDDRIESVSDITSIQGSDSTYMSMDTKRRLQRRPKPSKSTENIFRGEHDGVVYENLMGDPPPPLPSRSRNQSTTSLNQRPERLPTTAPQGQAGIRLIPGKNGTIEVQYGGYGGTPLTIQFDTSQFGVTPSSDSQGNLVLNTDKPQYPDNDQFSSFSLDTVQTAQSEAYQPGFAPGNYGYRAGDLSMDSNEMESSHVSDVRRDAVRNAIQQTVYDMTSDGRVINKAPQAHNPDKHIYRNDDDEDEDDDVTSAAELNKSQLEAQQAHTQQQLQQAMEQLQHFELNQTQLQGIHQQLQQLMLQQQELQQQHLKFQEEQQKAMAKTKKKKPKSSKQNAQKPTQEPPALPAQPPPPPPPPAPPSPPSSAQETFVIDEDEVLQSPQASPNSPKLMNFSQALAFAKAVEASKSAENSPVTQRKKRPEPFQEDRAGPVGPTPKPRQQSKIRTTAKGTQQIVTTPEKNKWDVKPGSVTTVEMSDESHTAHMGHVGQMRQGMVQSHYVTPQSAYTSSADVESHAHRAQVEIETSESEESDYQTEEEEERPPMEILSQMTSKPQSHDIYYSITPDTAYYESAGRHTPDELNSYQPQRTQQTRQPASELYKVSDAVPSASASAKSQLEEKDTSKAFSDDDDNKGTDCKIESGKDESVNLDEDTGSNRRAISLDDVRVLSVTTSSPERNVTSPTSLELLRRNAKTPESFISSTSSARSGLNMRVTGEVPKAYNRASKGVARRAFMLHPPVGIESASEASDNEYCESPSHRSRSRLSSRSLYSPSSAHSPGRSPTVFEYKVPVPDPPRGGKLLGASIPKPYKSFGKIETRTDALEDALAEAEAWDREELLRAQEIHASRQEVEEAKQALIQKHIDASEELQKEGIVPDLPTSPVNETSQEYEYTIAHIENQKQNLTENKHIELQDQDQMPVSEQPALASEEELETATEDDSEDDEDDDEEKSTDSSSDSSDQGEFNFETGEISGEVEDELEDVGPIEPIEDMFEDMFGSNKRTVKPRPKVDPAKVEAARKAAEARKSPAGKNGKLSTAAHGGVGQPVSVSVSKAMMRRRMSPRRTPILAETIEETEEPIEEEEEEEEQSEGETESSSEVSEQLANVKNDNAFSSLSLHNKENLDEEEPLGQTGTTKEPILVQTDHTKGKVTAMEQRVGEGDAETVSTTMVRGETHRSNKDNIEYLDIAEGELDTSSEVEKYDELFEPSSKEAFNTSPLNSTSQKKQTEALIVDHITTKQQRGHSFGSDSASSEGKTGSLVSEPSVIEVKPTTKKPVVTAVTVIDDEDDEVAKISAAAEERKVKKKKKKSTSSVPGEAEGETKVVKKKKTKKKTADQHTGDSQTGATGLTIEGQLPGDEALTEKPKKKKKKEKDDTEVKKKKKKKTNSKTTTDVSENIAPNLQLNTYENIVSYNQEQDATHGSYRERKLTVPLLINTQHAVQQEFTQHSALDPLSPARSDTSEKSLGTPEGIEATLFGSKLDRQETVKENKEGPRKAGFWSGRKVDKEEPMSPNSPEDINRQYKSAMEGPGIKLNMDQDIAKNQRYLNDTAQLHMAKGTPMSQRQPPIGQEDQSKAPPRVPPTSGYHETDIDTVTSTSVITKKDVVANQKPAIPKKPKVLAKYLPHISSPVSGRSPNQTPSDASIKDVPYQVKQHGRPGVQNVEAVTETTPTRKSDQLSATAISQTKWGHSKNTTQPSAETSFDEAQAVSQLWKDNAQHEAEMQRILASVSETGTSSETAKHPTIGGVQPSWEDYKQMQKMALEGHTIYARDDEDEVEMELQNSEQLSWRKQIPGKTVGAPTVVRPQPVYALATRQQGQEAQPLEKEARRALHGQYEEDYVSVPGATVTKRAAANEPEQEDTSTTNFQRQISIRGKKKRKRQLPEGNSGAISDSEALKRSAGYDSDVGIHSEAEVHDMEASADQRTLQDAAMKAITDSLKNQPVLKPRRPIWDSDMPIHYTRGVYRPHNPPVLYGSSAYHGNYDDSALVGQMFAEKNKPNPFTESEGEADTEGAESPTSFRPRPYMMQHAPIAPHAFSAFQPVSPSNKRVTIVDKKPKKKKKRKDQPINTEPGPIDLDQYSATARLWLEQVDNKTVEKSKTMKMAIMTENQGPPAELVRNLPEYEMASDDVFLPPQWILIRGRTLRGMKHKSATSAASANKSYASESDFDMNPDRPLSPGRQSILFFRLGSNWKDLAWVLFDGLLSDADTLRMIKDIQLKNPGNIRDQVNDMMKRWWKKRGTSATIDELQKALDIVHTAYVQEEFFNRRSTITSYTDTEDDLEIGEVSDNDPDVSRIISEYDVRSPNLSFECDPPAISGNPVNRDSLIRGLNVKGLQKGRHDISRDSLARYSTASSGYFADQSFRHDMSRESILDESSDRFMIIQPQLKHQEYRHETTI